MGDLTIAEIEVTMERKAFKDVELFSKEKYIHVPLFSERTKVLLLARQIDTPAIPLRGKKIRYGSLGTP